MAEDQRRQLDRLMPQPPAIEALRQAEAMQRRLEKMVNLPAIANLQPMIDATAPGQAVFRDFERRVSSIVR